EITMLSFPARKVKIRISLNIERLTELLFAVVIFDFDNLLCFLFVSSCLMVHHQVEIDEESGLPAGIDGILKLFLSAVFGPDTAFLIKFAEIINIIGCITGIRRMVRFCRRRQPDGVEPPPFDLRSLL